MANKEHEQIFRQGVKAWNAWRSQYPDIKPDLSGVQLPRARLRNINLSGVNLRGANLRRAVFSKANLTFADLSEAYLRAAYFRQADLRNANLQQANLKYAVMVSAKLDQANLSNCCVYGVAAWDVIGTPRSQTNLIITRKTENPITVDNLKLAQYVYLLLNNAEIRDVINIITSKTVLLLGRFTPERKAILDALREELRKHDYLPIVFDFEKPSNKDFTETVKTLAGMSLFVIADITRPKSISLELQATIPDYMIPFVPILQDGESPFSMFSDLQGKYNWVLDVLKYDSVDNLVKGFKKAVIEPAIAKHNELMERKALKLGFRHISTYISLPQT